MTSRTDIGSAHCRKRAQPIVRVVTASSSHAASPEAPALTCTRAAVPGARLMVIRN